MNFKKLIITILFIGSFSIAQGGEVTGAGFVKSAMKKKSMNLQAMLNNGHALLLGEVTGAGRPMALNKIKVLVTAKEAFKMSNIKRIEFKAAGGLKLQNVDFFEINGKIVEAKSLKALVVKK